MTSWRDFQSAADRLRPMRRRRSGGGSTQRPAAPAERPTEPTSAQAQPAGESRADGSGALWRVERLVAVVIWAAVFWETTGFLALIAVVKAFHWQGTIASLLGVTYLVAVHAYGLRHGRGMQLFVMWGVFVLLAILLSGPLGTPADLDCEWGRYTQPC